MHTIVIVGAGELGGAVAQMLAARDRVGRVLLIDEPAGAAAGKALDLQQMGAIEGFHARVSGTDDLSRAAGCAVVVLADRFGPPSRELAGEEGVAMLRRLQPLLGTAALVAAGEGQAGLVLDAVRDLRLERDRVVGSAPEAFAAAVAAIVALEAQASPREVSVSVVGSPGHLAAPLNEAAVGGYALDRVVTPAQFARIEARAAMLWPPGPYALGAAAARMAEALVTGSRRSFSAYTVLDGELGVRNRVGALPVALGVGRVRQRRIPALTTRERVRLETALGAP